MPPPRLVALEYSQHPRKHGQYSRMKRTPVRDRRKAYGKTCARFVRVACVCARTHIIHIIKTKVAGAGCVLVFEFLSCAPPTRHTHTHRAQTGEWWLPRGRSIRRFERTHQATTRADVSPGVLITTTLDTKLAQHAQRQITFNVTALQHARTQVPSSKLAARRILRPLARCLLHRRFVRHRFGLCHRTSCGFRRLPFLSLLCRLQALC